MSPQYNKVRPAFQKYILSHPSVPRFPKPVWKFCQAAPYRKTDNPKIFFYFGAPFFPAGFLNWSVNCWVRGFLPYTCRTHGGDGEGGEVGRRRHQYELLLSLYLSFDVRVFCSQNFDLKCSRLRCLKAVRVFLYTYYLRNNPNQSVSWPDLL